MEQELTIEQCRPYHIGILNHIDSFCRDHGIQYSLGYGTLIGAIRHKGFIPWDDDIDIIMTRDNYDRFIELHRKETNEQGRYRVLKGQEIANHLHAVVSDENTSVKFRKGTADDIFYHGGVWVDIFPLDNVTDDQTYEETRKRIFKLRKKQILAEIGNLPSHKKVDRVLRNIIRPFVKLSARSVSRSLDEAMLSQNNIETDHYASYSVWYSKQKPIPKSLFREYIQVDFEEGKYSAMAGYDEYLRGIYGDYMQLPPEDKRIPSHGYTVVAKSGEI